MNKWVEHFTKSRMNPKEGTVKTRIKEVTSEQCTGSNVATYYPQYKGRLFGFPVWYDMNHGLSYYLTRKQAEEHIDKFLNSGKLGVVYSEYPVWS